MTGLGFVQEAYYQINRGKAVVRKLIAEMAYMGLVGTLAVPPFGVLRSPLASTITPEIVSALALEILKDDPNAVLNSRLGLRLGGIPACDMLKYHELYVLCRLVKENGDRPLYAVVDALAPHLGVALSNLGYREGDLLITALRVLKGEASSAEQAQLFKLYDEWGLYAHINVRHSGRTL
jgi:hypothetical protein